MTRQHEEPDSVPSDLVPKPHETSVQAPLGDEQPGAVEKSIPQEATLDPPQKPKVKRKAKRTPRHLLIASLTRAKNAGKGGKPTIAAPAAAHEAATEAVVTQDLIENGDSTIPSANVEASSEVGLLPSGPEFNLDSQKQPLEPSLAQRVSALPAPGKDIHGPSKVTQAQAEASKKAGRLKARVFDSAAFDAAIYRQSEAIRPPAEVAVPSRPKQRPSRPSSEDQRMYIHANPAIHSSHNRSGEWFKAKALEMQRRGRRKAWFGKVVERQRWLRAQQRSQRTVVNGSKFAQRLTTPQPWTYSRPVDFGDVPESQLPQDVLQNPAWRKACAWHREMHRVRHLRQREVRKSEQETRQFYKNVMESMQPGPK
ncbi:hypothetical protein CDD83_7327 [Cordyceps sp. RAO-2017]|nr:hypothetical protein CDD83_7327 [Cordyceps sp. RAO-2017]